METKTALVTFEIRTEYLGSFRREFEKLARRAKKLKLAEPTYEVVGEKTVPAIIHEGVVKQPAKQLTLVKVSGQAPQLAGWTFVAVLQHEEKGNIVHRVPGTTVEFSKDLRVVEPFCNHCKTLRRRNDTYVVAHEDGRQLQIGRNCLKDFTGHDSPEAIARWAEILGSFIETVGDEDELGAGGFGGEAHWPLVTFLAVVAAVIRESGWMSRTKAREFNQAGGNVSSTADMAVGYLNARNETDRKKFVSEIKDSDATRANVALEYAKQHFDGADEIGTELSDYEHNLRLVVEGGSTGSRAAGIAASVVSFSERLMGKEMERRKSTQSEFQGEIKKAGTWTLMLTRVIEISSEMYGASHIHLFQDEAGNRFTWKTGTVSLEAGNIYRVVGTVKEHKLYIPRDAKPDFAGIKQTILTRCNTDCLVPESTDGAWTAAAAKRTEVEAELAAKVKAAKEEAKAAKKAAKLAAKDNAGPPELSKLLSF